LVSAFGIQKKDIRALEFYKTKEIIKNKNFCSEGKYKAILKIAKKNLPPIEYLALKCTYELEARPADLLTLRYADLIRKGPQKYVDMYSNEQDKYALKKIDQEFLQELTDIIFDDIRAENVVLESRKTFAGRIISGYFFFPDSHSIINKIFNSKLPMLDKSFKYTPTEIYKSSIRNARAKMSMSSSSRTILANKKEVESKLKNKPELYHFLKHKCKLINE
jgi:hypothetical protein